MITQVLAKIPFSTFLALAPALAALLLSRTKGLNNMRYAAVAVHLLLTLLSLAAGMLTRIGYAPILHDAPLDIAFRDQSPAFGPFQLILGLDPLSTLTVPVLLGAATGVLATAPNSALTIPRIRSLLVMESAMLATMMALDGLTLLCGWALGTIAGYSAIRFNIDPMHRKLSRPYGLYVGMSTLCIAVGVFMLYTAGVQKGLAQPLDVAALATAGIPQELQGTALLAFVLATMLRMGIAPLHSWVPAVASRGPLTTLSLHLAAPLGMSVLLRVAIPLLPQAAAHGMPILLVITACSALYHALIGMVQTELRRAVVFVRGSQGSLMLMGACMPSILGITGAALQAVVIAIAIPALMILVVSFEARIGKASLPRLKGAVHTAPWAVGMWALISIATVGFPGTLGFICEDLLLQSVIDRHPWAAFILIFVTALNGITLLMIFFRGLTGPKPLTADAPHIPDLRKRERIPLAFALISLVLMGILPGRLLLLESHLADHGPATQHSSSHPASH